MDSVYQCYIEFLPREILLKKYKTLEQAFPVTEKPNQALMPIHYNEFREEINELWTEKGLSLNGISKEIKVFNLKEYSRLKGEFLIGWLDGNYCSIHFDTNTYQINYFQFGIDITKKETKDFVESILEFAVSHNFVLLGSDLELFEPTLEEIDTYFRKSPAYKFIKSEVEFVKAVESGKEKTDVPFFKSK